MTALRRSGAAPRRLYLAESGEDLRGEDAVEAEHGQPYAVRFHLHPGVNASLQQDGEGALLRLPSGGGWRLRADGARITLEESIYLGGAEPRRSEQVVLHGAADGSQHVKWALRRWGEARPHPTPVCELQPNNPALAPWTPASVTCTPPVSVEVVPAKLSRAPASAACSAPAPKPASCT